jgi:hypothetical protein
MNTTRRSFLQRTAASTLVATSALQFPFLAKAQSPNSKLNLASIGVNGRAAENLAGVAGENIVALADVDANSLEAAAKKFTGARKYRDFRVMLEQEADKIDAVLVSTPDHTHAPAAAMALRMGKHVYCEKPLTHTVHEARVLRELAAANNCVTQMGTQIHAGENYRRVVELIQTGAIGEVREVHVWVNTDPWYSGATFQPIVHRGAGPVRRPRPVARDTRTSPCSMAPWTVAKASRCRHSLYDPGSGSCRWLPATRGPGTQHGGGLHSGSDLPPCRARRCCHVTRSSRNRASDRRQPILRPAQTQA